MRQLKLFSDKTQTQFGGNLLTGRRKCRRPLSLKNSHHLVLKAKVSVCLLQSRAQVEAILRKYGARFGVKIYALAVHSDHIHLQICLSSRAGYVKWIRAVTSVLVQKIRGLQFGLRPWTRIVAWERPFGEWRLTSGTTDARENSSTTVGSGWIGFVTKSLRAPLWKAFPYKDLNLEKGPPMRPLSFKKSGA